MKNLFLPALSVLLLGPIVALACFAPKPEQVASSEELVKRTKDIYLAEAKSLGSDGLVEFKVIEKLKGKKRVTFQLAGSLSDSDAGSDFSKHSRKDFWEASGGRAQIEPSCQIVPAFQKGKKYLVFLNKPYHLKSFELIESDDDAWLVRVKNEIKTK